MASRSEVYSDLSSRFTLIKIEAPAYGTVTSSQGRSRESFDHHCDVSIVTSSSVYSRLKTFFIATARVAKDAADYTGCENDTASCVSTLDHVAAYPASPILGSVDSTNLP